jgi:hypothetical protein
MYRKSKSKNKITIGRKRIKREKLVNKENREKKVQVFKCKCEGGRGGERDILTLIFWLIIDTVQH